MDRELWNKCVNFHGHQCPGLAIGYKVCEAAKKKLGIDFSRDEQIVCVTENDACGVDAVQVLTGCSFGKGNIIYRGTGKMAFSFFVRSTGEKIRIVSKRNDNRPKDREEGMNYILNADVDDLFDYKEPKFKIPERARLFTTEICELCGEGAPENKMRFMDGKKVCLDCFKDYTRGW